MEKSYKSSENSEMSDVELASALIRQAVSVDAGTTIGERIVKTARKLGWNYSRTRDVWHEQARRIDAFEMDQLRAAKIACQIAQARKAHAELTNLIAGMEAALDHIDPDFHRPSIAALRNSRGETAESVGLLDRTRAPGDKR